MLHNEGSLGEDDVNGFSSLDGESYLDYDSDYGETERHPQSSRGSTVRSDVV